MKKLLLLPLIFLVLPSCHAIKGKRAALSRQYSWEKQTYHRYGEVSVSLKPEYSEKSE